MVGRPDAFGLRPDARPLDLGRAPADGPSTHGLKLRLDAPSYYFKF
jgi:hypothetical protein